MGSILALAFLVYKRDGITKFRLRLGLRVLGLTSLVCLLALSIHAGVLRHLEVRSSLSFAVLGYSLLASLFTSVVGLVVLNAESGLWIARIFDPELSSS